MNARWFVAKYMPDPHRREPVNLGVILVDGGDVVARFLGESSEGKIDGRNVRLVRSVAAYKGWVAHWRRLADEGPESVQAGLAARTGDNYFLEIGGERLLAGADRSTFDLLDDLYTSLVDDTPDAANEDVGRLSEKVLTRLPLPKPVHRESLVTIEHDGLVDELRFDYRYNNGVPHLMQRVGLTFRDQRSWDRVHAAAWSFERVAHADNDELRHARLIALVKPREEDRALDRQLRQLSHYADVVDVSHQDEAAETLQLLLGEGDLG